MAITITATGAAGMAAGAWAWNTYGKLVTDKLIGKVKQPWDRFNWDRAAERYRANLLDLHSTIRILGKSDPVELEGIFTDVYVLDEVSARKRYGIEELRERGFDRDKFRRQDQERRNGLEMIEQGKNFFILGKPGAGKTTFLRYITLLAAQEELDKVLIYLPLHQWSIQGGGELMPFLAQQFDMCDFPDAQPFIEHLLQSGNAIVLFDGLDEVNQEGNRRSQLTLMLNSFAKKYRNSQILITCRIAASEYHFEGFQDVEVADFTYDQVHAYIDKWFGKDTVKHDAMIADLYHERNAGLRELCSVPLLLSMLCLAFEDTMHLPEQRAELYDDALDALLRKWDSSRSIQRDEIYQNLSR